MDTNKHRQHLKESLNYIKKRFDHAIETQEQMDKAELKMSILLTYEISEREMNMEIDLIKQYYKTITDFKFFKKEKIEDDAYEYSKPS
jgi:hypothetical protein